MNMFKDALWVGTRSFFIGCTTALCLLAVLSIGYGVEHHMKQFVCYALILWYCSARIWVACWRQLIAHYKEKMGYDEEE